MKKAKGRPGYVVTVAIELETRCLCSLRELVVILAIAIGINSSGGAVSARLFLPSGTL